MDDLLNGLSDLCPFTDVISYLRGGVSGAPDWLRALNWFVPMGLVIKMLIAWGAAIAVWYVVSIALRWYKAVE